MSTVVVTQGTTRTVGVATAGPQGVRGAQGWVWQGPWDIDTDYHAEVVVGGVVTVGADAVSHDGSTWLAVADSTGMEPTALAAEWELIAEKGEPNTLTVTATTLPVGEPATAVISGDAPAQAIAFGLPTGATGATGPAGPANSLAIGTVTTGAPGSSAAADITGTAPSQTLSLTVPRGATGASILSGTGAPSSGLGLDADYYLDTATSNLYGPKAAGAWPAPVSLVGAPSSLYDANTILAANTDNTPAALTIAEQRIVGRKTGGSIAALTGAEVLAIAAAAPAASPTLTGTVTIPTPAAGSNTTVAASTAWAAERAVVGNLLTANQASVETDLTGITAGSSATIARSTAWGSHGSASLEVTCTAAAFASAQIGNVFYGFPVTPGQVYTAVATSKTASARTTYSGIQWRTAAGSFISNSNGSAMAATGGNVALTCTAVAPANAAGAFPILYTGSGSVGDVVAFDSLGLWAGAGGDWAMPGTPITNLGTKVSRPNIDDYLCQQWSSAEGKWVSTRYDTGRRALTLANGWTATTAALRRHNGKVELLLVGLNGASSSSATIVTLDSAFRPPVALGVHWIGDTATTVPNHIVAVSTAGVVSVDGTRTNITAGTVAIRFDTEAARPTSLPGSTALAAPA